MSAAQQMDAAGKACVPEGYAIVPTRLTAENGAKAALIGEFVISVETDNPDYDDQDDESSPTISYDVSVPWVAIKEIWAAGIAHFAASPTLRADMGADSPIGTAMLAELQHMVRWHDQLSLQDIARAEAVIAKATGA